jgi:2-C-methyl-D-erythritol 4-phosphate cytidylyltransferase
MVAGLLVAAGEGKRFGKRKQYIEVRGKPLISYSLKTFEDSKFVDFFYVVTNEDEVEKCRSVIRENRFLKCKGVVLGGKKRQDSVRNGLRVLPQETKWVLIHDGARPLLSEEIIERCVKAAQEGIGVITAVPEVDTVKKVKGDYVVRTLDRSSIWRVQTPQLFPFLLLKEVHEKAWQEGVYFTDDAALFEWAELPVKVVMGDYRNIKLTYPEDLSMIEFLLGEVE